MTGSRRLRGLDRWRGLMRARASVARAARVYAERGWPVAPGAWWTAASGAPRYECGVPGCVTTGLHPVGSMMATVTEPSAATSLWSDLPHSVLLPTGVVCDVVEAPHEMGAEVWAALSATREPMPVATLPDRRWLFFAAPDLDPDLHDVLSRAGALHHGRGSWVPLPPSRLAGGMARWARPPASVGWRLPALAAVARALPRMAPRPARAI